MKKVIDGINIKSIAIAVILAFVLIVLFTIQAKAQHDLVAEMALHLEQQNVPVVSVKVSKRIPFYIEIMMQSTSAGTLLDPSDSWNKHLAFREAALSHRYGLAIDSFTLVIINEEGDIIDWEQNFLYPDSPSRQPFLSNLEKLDEKTAQKIITEQFDFNGLLVDKINVLKGAGSRDDVQTLELELSTLNLLTANEAIPVFMGSLQSQIIHLNKESDSVNISICRVWIRDGKGNLLLKYLYDFEVGRHAWGIADGVTEDWFPHPEFEDVITPTVVFRESNTPTPDPYP